MKISQKKKVVQQLKNTGEVSRNWSIQNYIYRLSAIIQNLEKENYVFKPYWDEGDYIYKLVEVPKRIVSKVEIRDGKAYEVKVTVPLF